MQKTAEQQRSRQLEYRDFNLINFKLTDDGVNVSHHESGTDAGTLTKAGEVQPHPDLQAKLDLLKPFVALRLGILEGWNYSREELRGDLDKLAHAKKMHDEAIDFVKVTGVKYASEGDKAGVIISGYLKLPKGGGFGFAIPKISFEHESLGYEKEVQEICESLKEEIYAYRFQQKKLQLDIVTESEKNEDDDLFATKADKDKKGAKKNKDLPAPVEG